MEGNERLTNWRLDRVDKEIADVKADVASVKKDISDVKDSIVNLDQRMADRFAAQDSRALAQMGATVLTLITALIGLLVTVATFHKP
jgi:septal ring factor EnvC (AmiA/AmiB activator)